LVLIQEAASGMSSMSEEAADEKLELRRSIRDRRDALTEAERSALSAAVATVVFAAFDGPPAIVSSFWAMGSEIDPGPLEARLRTAGHHIALPVMQGRNQPLQFRLWNLGDPLVDRIWGIREPTAAAPVVEPDILLVPLLAFDAAGWRLGYGAGFYDRTLRTLRERKAILAVGLAFDEQRVDAVPHLDYDEPLDWVVTPSGAVRCTR
jgi:5-formyltetrahydrofolate cyclo-ligase